MFARRIAVLTASLALLLAGAFAANAGASFHLMKVTEVHKGATPPYTGDYVELQMYSGGQSFVAGHYVRTYDGGSNAFATFQIPANVANGDNQRTVLIANDASVTGADFNAAGNLNIVNANGGVCFLDSLLGAPIDCVAWGSPVGALPSPAGTPLALPADTLGVGQSISRKITAGCATLLEGPDDTNNSAADFALATPSPRSNSVTPTEKPCASQNNPPKKKCKKKAKKKSAGAAAKKKCKKKKKKKK